MTDDDSKEIERIRSGLVSVWQVWIAWFCWFFGANVLVFWVRAGKPIEQWEALCWLTYNLSGVIAAWLLGRYCWTAGNRAHALLGDTRHLGFPIAFAVLGALLNGLALVINSAAWAMQLWP